VLLCPAYLGSSSKQGTSSGTAFEAVSGDMSHGNLKKDLDEVNISLFSAVSAWMKKRGKVRKNASRAAQHSVLTTMK
jgi:hypothetical protein